MSLEHNFINNSMNSNNKITIYIITSSYSTCVGVQVHYDNSVKTPAFHKTP